MTEYLITIERREPNPDYQPTRNQWDRGPEQPEFSSRTVTTATLDPEQWAKVQAAIVEALE